ncbi:MAG: hypothetical protein ACKVQA_12190 [Burkholderiales bacterium]
MRIISFIAYAAIFFGIAGIFAGDHFGMAKALHLSIFLIGAGLALGGLAALATRRMSMRFSSDPAPSYDGFPALVWGLMLFAIGTAVIGYAYALNSHSWGRVAAVLLRYPGAMVAVAGLFLMGLSVLLFVHDGSNRPWWNTLLFRVPRILIALVVLVCGVVVAAGGAWYTADAKGFAKFERRVSERLELALKDTPALEPMKRARRVIAARFAG